VAEEGPVEVVFFLEISCSSSEPMDALHPILDPADIPTFLSFLSCRVVDRSCITIIAHPYLFKPCVEPA
jgi:hypothetical protein